MPLPTSPLRYPGGKSSMYGLITAIMRSNNLQYATYAEPYAGGGGLALHLLFNSYAHEIHLNDVDPAIWSFWHAVLNCTDDFLERLNDVPVTIDEWHRQREILAKGDVGDPLKLGFAAFFLNRTNRSGIIKDAGVIGGLTQTGKYKIDCRFTKQTLAKRILRIGAYRERIHLSRKDAVEFISDANKNLNSALLCVDPPYFNKGSSLYTSFYNPEDHAVLANTLLHVTNPFVVTYDNVLEIRQLYKSLRQYTFDVQYSLQEKRLGTEVMIASKGLRMPIEAKRRQIRFSTGQLVA